MTTAQNKSPPETNGAIGTLRYMLDKYHSEGSLRKIELFAWLNHDAPMLMADHEQLLMALEALQKYASERHCGSHHDPVWTQVADAIAKARGQQ